MDMRDGLGWGGALLILLLRWQGELGQGHWLLIYNPVLLARKDGGNSWHGSHHGGWMSSRKQAGPASTMPDRSSDNSIIAQLYMAAWMKTKLLSMSRLQGLSWALSTGSSHTGFIHLKPSWRSLPATGALCSLLATVKLFLPFPS